MLQDGWSWDLTLTSVTSKKPMFFAVYCSNLSCLVIQKAGSSSLVLMSLIFGCGGSLLCTGEAIASWAEAAMAVRPVLKCMIMFVRWLSVNKLYRFLQRCHRPSNEQSRPFLCLLTLRLGTSALHCDILPANCGSMAIRPVQRYGILPSGHWPSSTPGTILICSRCGRLS